MSNQAPEVIFSNIKSIYKTDWFLTDQEIQELKQNFVFRNTPVASGDIYQGMYIGIAHKDFDNYLKGGKIYHAIIVCKSVIDKVHKS